MAADSLTITDSRTGKSYEIPIMYGTFPTYGAAIRTADLRQIKVSDDDFGLMGYDPAFMNTASTKSTITHIDGERGILRYRGYPIEQIAEQSNYLEVAYLVIHGELPTKAQYDEWVHNITYHTMVHENLKKFMDGFNYDASGTGSTRTTIPGRGSSSDWPSRSLRSRDGTRSSTWPWSWSGSPWRTISSSSGSSTRTPTSTPGSSARRWASPPITSPSCSPSPEFPDGWPSGRS